MARDDTKLQYASPWDIDQLIENNEKDITTADTVLFTNTIVSTISSYEVYFKPSGDTRWFKMGRGSTNGSFTGAVSAFAYMSGNALHIKSNLNGRARWFVWSDKVDY